MWLWVLVGGKSWAALLGESSLGLGWEDLTGVSWKQPIPYLQLRPDFLRRPFPFQRQYGQILSKYMGKEASGLRPVCRRRTLPIRPSSQIYCYTFSSSEGSPLRGKRAVQKLLPSDFLQSVTPDFFHQRITCDWLWKKQQEMIICVAPHVPALLGQATSCIPAWPWRAAFLNLSPASDPLLLSPSGSWRSNC